MTYTYSIIPGVNVMIMGRKGGVKGCREYRKGLSSMGLANLVLLPKVVLIVIHFSAVI